MSPIPTLKYLLSFYHDHDHHTRATQPIHHAAHHVPAPTTLTKRYDAISIPASYGRLSNSPAPGTVAGIVLGSVIGFVFLLYLIYLALSSGRRFSSETEMSESVDVGPVRRTPSRRVREVVEEEYIDSAGRRRGRWVRRPQRGPPPGDRIVVEESMTSASRSEESNVVEVIEEHSSVEGRRPRNARGGWRRGDPYEISEYESSR